ncbi:hypothetical protein E2I00_001848, partial [Balaenoptera physalus]
VNALGALDDRFIRQPLVVGRLQSTWDTRGGTRGEKWTGASRHRLSRGRVLTRMSGKLKERKRTPVSHKVIEKRRRDRINRCLNELGKTVPMALAKQVTSAAEKTFREAGEGGDPRDDPELLAEFANYFHYGYHECMKNLVHYLTTVERMETKDTKYARILAFLQLAGVQ